MKNEKENENIFFEVACVVFLIIIIYLWTPHKGTVSEELMEETWIVTYERVNLREEPGLNSDIIGEKFRGDSITLTGKTCYFPISDFWGDWWETTEGWIVIEAISTK